MTNRKPRWTDDELDYLEEHGAVLGHKLLSQHLGRSINAIKLKQTRENIRLLDYAYTATVLAKELGCTRTCLWHYRKKGWIQGIPAAWRTQYGSRPVIFKEAEIVRFLKRFAHLFRRRKVPNRYFANVIAQASEGG